MAQDNKAEDGTYLLARSFAGFSSGTAFKVNSVVGGSIAKCTTRSPIEGSYLDVDIPLEFLVKKRTGKPATHSDLLQELRG